MNDTQVFLAEGETHVRQALQLSLDHLEGISVCGSAKHTESLLAQISQNPPDCLLLDWLLPGMNPQRLLPVLRKYCPRTSIIAMVIHPKVGERTINYGMDGYILKGLPPEDFISSFQKTLEAIQDRN
jgi:DNA-binding NarL/FixJ family response regulator